MKKITIKATRSLAPYMTCGEIYKGEYDTTERNPSVSFCDDRNDDVYISLESCLDGSWFRIIPNKLNKKIKVL
jgi:hypothetical protein